MRPFFVAGFVALALLSPGCIFGGGDPDPTPTRVPPPATETPAAEDDTATPSEATATTEVVEETATPDASVAGQYIVQPGDYLSTIAADHGVTVEALVAANNITDPDKIFVGQVLTIPAVE